MVRVRKSEKLETGNLAMHARPAKLIRLDRHATRVTHLARLMSAIVMATVMTFSAASEANLFPGRSPAKATLRESPPVCGHHKAAAIPLTRARIRAGLVKEGALTGFRDLKFSQAKKVIKKLRHADAELLAKLEVLQILAPSEVEDFVSRLVSKVESSNKRHEKIGVGVLKYLTALDRATDPLLYEGSQPRVTPKNEKSVHGALTSGLGDLGVALKKIPSLALKRFAGDTLPGIRSMLKKGNSAELLAQVLSDLTLLNQALVDDENLALLPALVHK